MEYRCGQCGVNIGLLENVNEMLNRAGTAGRYQRDRQDFTGRAELRQVVACACSIC